MPRAPGHARAAARARAPAAKRALPAGVSIRPLTPGDWPTVEQLFGPKGACGGCWCMWWRLPTHGRAWREAVGEPNRRALRALIRAGQVHAVLAVHGEEAVAWCTFGPRESFPFLVKSRALARPAAAGRWSVVCFYLPPAWRRRGLGRALLEAATARAFALGAAEVEGFPVVPRKPGATIPAAFAWTGLPAQFEAAGFVRLKRAAGARPIYVRRAPRRRRSA
jgi:GNAT superfamily N-acetyltransferase